MPSWGEYRFGVRRATGDTKLVVGDPSALPEPKFERGEYFAQFQVDTLDNVSFPRKGTVARTEWRGSRSELGSDVPYDQLLVSAVHANTWGRHTMLTTLRYDSTTDGVAPLNRHFTVGGLFDLSGLNHNQLSGQNAARIGLAYYRRIGDLALFPAFAGVSMELGNVWQTRSEVSTHNSIFGASLWAGVQTPVGPVYVAYGRTDEKSSAFYVLLGRAF
jgi:NTE family protein